MYPKIHFTFVETEINIFKEAGESNFSHSISLICFYIYTCIFPVKQFKG